MRTAFFIAKRGLPDDTIDSSETIINQVSD